MEEKKIIEHFIHGHQLSRIPDEATETDWDNWCYGCWRYFLPGEAAYGCSVNCGDLRCLHEECLEMPRQIKHPVHSSHSLTQEDLWSAVGDDDESRCAVCDDESHGLGYICSRGCALWIHLGCWGRLDVAAEDEYKNPVLMNHRSHPQHELRFSKRSSSFKCDACGDITEGKSYICSICNYWIDESCARLPATESFHHHSDHSLSLAFLPPYEYIRNEFVCGICREALRLKHWVYHCQLCRYVVHINCATNAPSNLINNENVADDDKDTIKGPIIDIYEEMIKPFVKRERAKTLIPHEGNEIISAYKFHNHPLRFTTFSSSHVNNEEEDEDEDDDGDDDDDDDVDDDDNRSRGSELTCDGCTLPIHDQNDNGYMSCGECKYFLHLACSNLPPELPSHPLHPIQHHNLTLQKPDKLPNWSMTTLCKLCNLFTNGFYYACTKCSFKVDIKCASLPDTMKHAGHPQHHHYLKPVTENHRKSFCGVCYYIIPKEKGFYRCDSCKYFSICCRCVLLPASNKHRLEKHLLPLTYDARVNHPGEFYCGNCETKMNPKSWMYHCRDCDQSFHPKCFPATSGDNRNINFGSQQYLSDHHPHHPLRFQIISKKKRCDLCRTYVYDLPGYQCTSCNFVMCRWCARSVKPIESQ